MVLLTCTADAGSHTHAYIIPRESGYEKSDSGLQILYRKTKQYILADRLLRPSFEIR